MKPNTKKIKSEIARLKKYKELVPHHTLFGDDNWKRIDVTLDVLEKRMDRDDALDHVAVEYCGDCDENSDRDLCHRSDLERTAEDAVDWLEGETDAAPSKDWEPLTKNNK